MYTSTDGINWKVKTYTFINNDNSLERKGMGGCCYSEKQGKLIAYGYSGILLYTVNIQNNILNNVTTGIEWGYLYAKFKYSSKLKKIYGIFRTQKYQSNSRFATSDDGVHWDILKSHMNGATQGSDVVYSEYLNLFINAYYSKIQASADGINWQDVDTEHVGYKNSICYSETKKIFVICGAEGLILTSVDGINWVLQNSETTENLNFVYYDYKNEMFYIGGDNGTILKSSDGVNWESVVTNLGIDIISLGYYEVENLFIVGNHTTPNENKITQIYSGDTLEDLELRLDFSILYPNDDGYENVKSLYINEYTQEILILSSTFLITSKNGIYYKYELNTDEMYKNIMSLFLPKYNRNIIFEDYGIIKISESYDEKNIIQNLDENSDITFGLDVGKNGIVFNSKEGNGTAVLSFRQKYIGV